MVGGGKSAVERLKPLLEKLAPAKATGWEYVVPSGSGHYVKMMHNCIEYGMMQAYAKAFAKLKRKQELAPDLHQVAKMRTGSAVRSWLLELNSNALRERSGMEGIAPYLSDSGKVRWTVAEALDTNVPAPVITLSLLQRLASRDTDSYADKLLTTIGNQFGGNAVKTAA